MNSYTCNFFQNILYDIQTKGKWEIIVALQTQSEQKYFDTLHVEVHKKSVNCVLPSHKVNQSRTNGPINAHLTIAQVMP